MDKKINITVASGYEIDYEYRVSEEVFTKFFKDLNGEEFEMDEVYEWLYENCHECKIINISQNDPHMEFIDISEGE